MSIFASDEPRPRVRHLTGPEFDAIRDLVRAGSGIDLHAGKKALVFSRLENLVRRYGFDSFRSYTQFVANRRHGPEFIEFIDRLTTNHSGFWREPEHFVFLRQHVFPIHRNRIRVWSAPCATGEEPYTIAMSALDANVSHCAITGSDISRTALSVAIQGEYDESKVDMLPAGWKERFFRHRSTDRGGIRTVIPIVRSLITFAPLNLLEPFGHLGHFDAIFCRNMMIYFDQPTRDGLVERLSARLTPGGYLFTGHSETLLRLPAGLEYIQPATYRKLG